MRSSFLLETSIFYIAIVIIANTFHGIRLVNYITLLYLIKFLFDILVVSTKK